MGMTYEVERSLMLQALSPIDKKRVGGGGEYQLTKCKQQGGGSGRKYFYKMRSNRVKHQAAKNEAKH